MRLVTILFVPALMAATPSPPITTFPAALQPYIVNGQFDPGDYKWLRGQFANASKIDQANSRAIEEWKRRCFATNSASVRSELKALEIDVAQSLDTLPSRDPICAGVSATPWPLDLADWEGFAHDVQIVRPIAKAYLSAVVNAENIAASRSPALGDLINARAMGEQMLRFGSIWAAGNQPDSPALTPRQRAILESQITIVTIERDHANTEWLKRVVTEQGWPRRSVVGDGAAGVAWLLAQHADADPAFQLRALRLMEPMVKVGEVDRKNYAYLYDRVMLKITGRQRYATQMTCKEGRYVPQPLESPARVEAQRQEVGLDTLAMYEQQMVRSVGPCPTVPNPTKAS